MLGVKKYIHRSMCSYRIMKYNELLPPTHVQGMTVLDRYQFRKTVSLPVLDLSNITCSALPDLKRFSLKICRLKPVQGTQTVRNKLLLQPMAVKAWDGIPIAFQVLGITEDNLTWREYELTYDCWNIEEILKSILPMGEYQHTLPSYTYVGHIIHLNLAEHLLPYKMIIGEVLLDKQPHCRTVTNKCQKINDTFRSVPIEVLCGDHDFKTTDKKNGIEFEFDFSTVYWNPRLKGEHQRIVKLLRPGDVLYEVFAGIGPFSIPAGKSKCTVLANDLNPESFKWLQANIRRNKVTKYVSAFNKNGRDFICNEIKNDLVSRWRNNEPKDYKIHITMNLPAMAVEFLNCFCGLLNDIDEVAHPIYPLVHVYCFTKGENTSDIAKKLVEDNLGQEFGDNLDGVHFVKQVGLGRRYMYRVSFYLNHELLTAKKEQKQLEA